LPPKFIQGHPGVPNNPFSISGKTTFQPAGIDVALGLWEHQTKRTGGMLDRFAEHVSAKTYSHFYGESYPTEAALEKMMYHADRLHVNLDGVVMSVEDIPSIVEAGARGLSYRPKSGGGNITNWEIWRLHQDPELLKKTIFYLNGKAVYP